MDTNTTTAPMAPDFDDLLEFDTLKRAEFPRDASVIRSGQKSERSQGVGSEVEGCPVIDVSTAVGNSTSDSVTSPIVEPVQKPKRKRPGRPPKRGRPKLKGPDKRMRVMAGPLKQSERRDILEAVQFGRHMGHEPNTTINFQPVHLDNYPENEDMGMWFRNGIMRDIATFFARERDNRDKPLRWWAFATRENYVGERREHLHIVLWCPLRLREKLLTFLRRRYPGGTAKGRMAVHLGPLIVKDGVDGIEYRLKQAEGNAAGPPRPGRPVAETCSRHDGAEVAPVFGKRYIISQTLARSARSENGWQRQQDEMRRVRSIISKAQREAAKTTAILPTGII